MLTGALLFWALIKLSTLLLVAGAIVFALTVFLMASALLRPPRMNSGKAMFFLNRLTPADLQLPYETVQFTVADQRTHRPLRLAAWWIPRGESLENPLPASDRCAILLHGYTDAKVGAIAWAPLMRSLGFNVLAIDLRAHGDSQGVYSTAAFYERHDISQVIDQLKQDRPGETRRIVLFGASLGAAVAAAVAALRNDLAGVVLESPYANFPSAFLSHGDRLGIPGRLFQKSALRVCEFLAGINYRDAAPLHLIPRIKCPLLVIQSGCDPFVPAPDQQAIAAAVAARPTSVGPSRVWQVDDCRHVLAMQHSPVEFRRQLETFLTDALAAPPTEVLPQ